MPRQHFTEDSKEKTEVRNKLWNSIFDKILEKKTYKNVRYLCFPGEKCHYVKYLVENNNVLIKNCVAVEENPFKAGLIKTEFSKLGEIHDPKEVHQGKMEDLAEDDIFKSLFPFDILNLDFEGPAFPATSISKSHVLTALETSFGLQSTRMKEFFVILTFKLYDELRPNLRNQRIGHTVIRNRAEWLVKNYLRPVSSNSKILTNFLNAENSSTNFKNWCSLYAIPLDINLCRDRRFKVEIVDSPHTYIGESAQYNTRMVSYGLRFIKVDNPPRTPAYYRSLRDKCDEQIINSVHNTKWIKWNGNSIVYESVKDTDR